MAINRFGGGARTNIHGLRIEQETSLKEALVRAGYICNDYFCQECYKDVFEYIEKVECRYFFNEIPLTMLNLPTGTAAGIL